MLNTISKSHKMHMHWLKALGIIEQLHDLCFDLRSHRGTSTAQLEGDTFFYNITQNTAQRISQALVNIDDQQHVLKALDSYTDFLEITRLWLQIQTHWQEKKSYNNFLEQCELIDKVQNLIWKMAEQASPDLNSNSKKAALSRFLLITHAQMIENIARLRGLSCLYCARGELQRKDKKIIREDIQKVYQNWQKWLCELNDLPNSFRQQLNEKAHQNALKVYLDEFIQLVQGFQHVDADIPNASETFNAANRTLNGLNAQYKTGLELLKTCMQDDLQQWISNPPKVLLTNTYTNVNEHASQLANCS